MNLEKSTSYLVFAKKKDMYNSPGPAIYQT